WKLSSARPRRRWLKSFSSRLNLGVLRPFTHVLRAGRDVTFVLAADRERRCHRTDAIEFRQPARSGPWRTPGVVRRAISSLLDARRSLTRTSRPLLILF